MTSVSWPEPGCATTRGDAKKFTILFNELVTDGFRQNPLGVEWPAPVRSEAALNGHVLGSGQTIAHDISTEPWGARIATA
jgi:hypothetical protein